MASRDRNSQRQRIAQAAARLLHEGGSRDYRQARRKAARNLGIDDPRLLPDAAEIEAALREHRALFGDNNAHQWLRTQREAAREAMDFLARFQPRLVGPVLAGTADRHAVIELQVFSDPPDAVALFLAEQRIPYRDGERRLILSGDRPDRTQVLAFSAGGQDFELTVLPETALRQPPRELDGRPLARAGPAALDALLARIDHEEATRTPRAGP
ncbi:MAG: hypothetical protein KF823_13155 [Xanthomonadales bacterium]|nr:hypothetical protein [Xanthomonadales bacterium]